MNERFTALPNFSFWSYEAVDSLGHGDPVSGSGYHGFSINSTKPKLVAHFETAPVNYPIISTQLGGIGSVYSEILYISPSEARATRDGLVSVTT